MEALAEMTAAAGEEGASLIDAVIEMLGEPAGDLLTLLSEKRVVTKYKEKERRRKEAKREAGNR